MAARKNERKLEILRLVLEEEEVTSEDVADALGIEIHNSRVQLQRYWRHGLLTRRVVDRTTKKRAYRVSFKGKTMLRWLEKENNERFSLGKMSCAYPRTQ